MNVELTVASGQVHQFKTSLRTYCGIEWDGRLRSIRVWPRRALTCRTCIEERAAYEFRTNGVFAVRRHMKVLE